MIERLTPQEGEGPELPREGPEYVPLQNPRARGDLRRAIFTVIASALAVGAAAKNADAAGHESMESVAAHDTLRTNRELDARIKAWKMGDKKALAERQLKQLRDALTEEQREERRVALEEFNRFKPRLDGMVLKWRKFFMTARRTKMMIDQGDPESDRAHIENVPAEERNTLLEKARLAAKELVRLPSLIDSVMASDPEEGRRGKAKGPKGPHKGPLRRFDAELIGRDVQIRASLLHFEEVLDTFFASPGWAQRKALSEQMTEFEKRMEEFRQMNLMHPGTDVT